MASIIINPVSGGAAPSAGARRAAAVTAALEAHGVDGDVFITERRGHARELAEAAVRRGQKRVLAWGGDGTVNEVASALVHTDVVLGIVPAGSGNGLARELRIPLTPERAIAAALTAPPRVIDAGELGGRLFFSIAGIGFDAHIAAEFDRAGHGRRGFSTYARVTARELWGYRCRDYVVDGVPVKSALLLTFANSPQFGNGASIAPGALLDDGLLQLVVFTERSRAMTVARLPRLFIGGVERTPGISIRPVTHAVVESSSPMLFHVDGEPVRGGTRLLARVHPGALLVAG